MSESYQCLRDMAGMVQQLQGYKQEESFSEESNQGNEGSCNYVAWIMSEGMKSSTYLKSNMK
jgi:hypothetical protein